MTEEVVSFSFTTKRKTVTKTNTVMLFNYLGYMKKYTENALQVHTISAVKLILKKVFNLFYTYLKVNSLNLVYIPSKSVVLRLF